MDAEATDQIEIKGVVEPPNKAFQSNPSSDTISDPSPLSTDTKKSPDSSFSPKSSAGGDD